MKLKNIITILAAALGLTISAQARLGWTLEECQAQWGAPIKVHYYSDVNNTGVLFAAGDDLLVEVGVL
jgi:hypothetical protein